jgi:rhamnogalacturonyl hydrolase YesR
MRKLLLIGLVVHIIGGGCRNTRDVVFERSEQNTSLEVDSLINHFVTKYLIFLENFKDTTNFPRTFEGDKLILTSSSGWTSGFFPGILWNLYRHSGDSAFYHAAVSWTQELLSESSNTSTHDIGFIINCSAGLGYKITGDESYKSAMLEAAKSLASRYNEKTGCIKSLDNFNNYSFPVLIDNLVNLEILFKSWKWTDDDQYYKIAYSHILRTMENHMRTDFSAFQLVDYDPEGGYPVYHGTFQGYSDSSTWSRGQAWALYGYTMAYRETKDRIFLDQAERMAEFILKDPYFTDGYIPFWDMASPNIPQEPRDASAAAIMASALLELSIYEEASDQEKFFRAGENIILTLGNKEYCSGNSENSLFVVKHCIGNYPGKTEVDVPLIYADFYFLEALLKYAETTDSQKDE